MPSFYTFLVQNAPYPLLPLVLCGNKFKSHTFCETFPENPRTELVIHFFLLILYLYLHRFYFSFIFIFLSCEYPFNGTFGGQGFIIIRKIPTLQVEHNQHAKLHIASSSDGAREPRGVPFLALPPPISI